MELVARTAERSVEERCPYCHDALAASLPADDLVDCPGCATTHHRSCVEELGRCTIRGCERSLVASPEADAPGGRARRASVTDEVRRRLRERARRFVTDHSTAPRALAPVYETPAPSPELRLEGKAPDVARARQFVAEHAGPGGVDLERLLHTTLVDALGAKGPVRADLYRRAAELLRTPEGRGLYRGAAADAARYDEEAERAERPEDPAARRRRRLFWIVLAVAVALVLATMAGLLAAFSSLQNPPP